MAGQYTKIIATDYNTIQKKISAVMGTGGTNPNTDLTDTTFGYGQTVLSNQVSVSAKISSNQWANLKTDIIRARQHQTGATELLTDPTLSVKIGESERAEYNAMSDLCVTDRLLPLLSSQATRTSLATHARTASWRTAVYVYFTVDFTSADAKRHFFNTGGFFDITASRSGGTGGTKNTSWTTMLTNIGTLRFNRTNTTRIATNGTTTVVSPIGYSALTTSDQFLYQKLTETPTYSPNQFNFYARTGTASQIIFTLLFADYSPNPAPQYFTDELVDGTLTSNIESYRATGPNVSVPVPSVITSSTGS
jgi:hypothetical protein